MCCKSSLFGALAMLRDAGARERDERWGQQTCEGAVRGRGVPAVKLTARVAPAPRYFQIAMRASIIEQKNLS
jgi:hypothetical protein